MVRRVTDRVAKDGMFAHSFPRSHMNPSKEAGDTLVITWPVGNNSPSEAGQAQVSTSVITLPTPIAANDQGSGPIITIPANTPSRDVTVSVRIPPETEPGTYRGSAFLRGISPGSTLTENHDFTLTITAAGPDLFVVGLPTIG